MTIDFRNPFFSCRIITENGTTYPLWAKNPASRSAPSLSSAGLKVAKAFPYVTEITVEMQLAYLPVIKVSLAPPYREGIDFLNSKLVEWGQSILEVEYGYIQNRTPIMSAPLSGVLLKPDIQLGPDLSITLNAQGVGGFGASRQQGTITLNNVTRKQILDRLFQGRPIALDVSEVQKDSSSVEYKRMFVETINFVQGGDTVWIAAWKVIREARCYFLMTGGINLPFLTLANTQKGSTVKVLPQKTVFGGKPSRLLTAYDYSTGKIGKGSPSKLGEYPILSANSPTMAVYLDGATRGYYMADINSANRESVSKLVSDSNTAPARLGEGAATISGSSEFPSVDAQGNNAEMYPGDPTDVQTVAQVEAEYANATSMGVQLTMETLGDPTIMPGEVVAVRGLGDRLDAANYSVMRAIHKIGAGYTTSLETVSNVAQALKNAVVAVGPTSPGITPSGKNVLSNTPLSSIVMSPKTI